MPGKWREATIGLGDQLIASGLARGAAERGKRIAFGDGKKIRWDKNSAEIFRGNKNIATPGSERANDIEWVPFFQGSRLYNTHSHNKWNWNYDFKCIPGEIIFTPEEVEFAKSVRPGFILIEPNVPWWKSVAPNKDWGRNKYQAVADSLFAEGRDVVQFGAGRDRLKNVRIIETRSFRMACAALSRARMAILPEGGLHHAAAAVGIPAVVLFGGFIPPQVTGYQTHVNLTGGATACGSLTKCQHCRDAMEAITVEEVLASCRAILGEA